MPIGGSLAAMPVVLGGSSLTARACKLAAAVACACPGRAIVVAGRTLPAGATSTASTASTACTARLSVIGGLGRPRAACGLPADCAPVAIVGTHAWLRPLSGHVLEVIAVVGPQVPEGKKYDDKNQNDNCGQADHDRGHRTIQHGMA
jgi:hypothetical protein